MKNFIIGLLAVLMFVSGPVMAGNPGSMQVDPNDKAVITLLWMVYSDLQMCQSSLEKSLMDNVSAIGHLNNAQSALKKSEMDPAYYTLMGEIDQRISKIKFYLVMNERRAVHERLAQLMAVIKNVLGAGNGSLPNFGGYNGYNPGTNPGANNGFTNPVNNLPNGSGFVPVRPEVPVNGSVNPMPVMPSGVVPVR